jgi:hypothetical protein
MASLPPRAGHSHHRRAKAFSVTGQLASFDLALSVDQLNTLDDASRIELGFPYELYAKELQRTFAYGGMRDQILA